MTKYEGHQNSTVEPAFADEPFEALNSIPGFDFDDPDNVQTTDPLAQRFFTLSQAGKIFCKSSRTMRWWADTGRIRTIQIGRSRFITEAEIRRLQTGGEG